MNVLVVYCHPCEDSFNSAVLKVTLEALAEHGHDFRVSDLYREGFDPVMRAPDWRSAIVNAFSSVDATSVAPDRD